MIFTASQTKLVSPQDKNNSVRDNATFLRRLLWMIGGASGKNLMVI